VKRRMSRRIWQPLAILLLVIGLIGAPFLGTGYLHTLLVLAGLYVVAVAGLALLVGHAGQLSLAQGAFFGLGAYGFGILGVKLGWAPLAALPTALVGVGALAWLVGQILLRLRGHFFALGTLAFASIVLVLEVELGDWTGGPSGLAGIPRLLPPAPEPLTRDVVACWTAWVLAGLALLLFHRLTRSEVGAALRALSSTEVGAAAMGVDAHRLKLSVFVLAAVLGALAGAVYASYLSFISPAGFDVLLGVQFVVMVMIGGTATFWGPLLGAAAITALVEVLRALIPLLVPGARGPVEIVGLSLLLGVAMVLLPGGLAGAGAALQRGRGRLRAADQSG
jgi:branched-chain amino acid transport system permease protein